MIALPPPLGAGDLRIWRIDAAKFAPTWASGEGSFQVGGRWSSRGVRAVYAALDPATAILEVAVHKGFLVLDTQPHILTSARIITPLDVHVVMPDAIPNPNWLTPSPPNRNQQAYGDALLAQHRFVALPSVVSRHSWNLIFDGSKMAAGYDDVLQTRLALDPRLQG